MFLGPVWLPIAKVILVVVEGSGPTILGGNWLKHLKQNRPGACGLSEDAEFGP